MSARPAATTPKRRLRCPCLRRREPADRPPSQQKSPRQWPSGQPTKSSIRRDGACPVSVRAGRRGKPPTGKKPNACTILIAPMKVFVIVPAAGLGTRMAPHSAAKSRKKSPTQQFKELGGVPILVHTLRKFAAAPAVYEIIVALRKDEIAAFRTQVEKQYPEILSKRVQLVEGGEHRQDSVASALARTVADPEDIVLVHDAVRPFVTPEIIGQVIEAAHKHGAAIAGWPAVDTVKQVERTADGALIKATIPRAGVVMAQTPQGFRYGILKKAFDGAVADGFLGTDEASLIERAGLPVVVVMGSPRNIKITTPADMELAEFYLEHEDGNKS